MIIILYGMVFVVCNIRGWEEREIVRETKAKKVNTRTSSSHRITNPAHTCTHMIVCVCVCLFVSVCVCRLTFDVWHIRLHIKKTCALHIAYLIITLNELNRRMTDCQRENSDTNWWLLHLSKRRHDYSTYIIGRDTNTLIMYCVLYITMFLERILDLSLVEKETKKNTIW